MASYLAVGRGSRNESMMSVIEYKGNPDPEAKPIVLVGKGLTSIQAVSHSNRVKVWMR